MITCDAPHPGFILRRCMADRISVTALAEHLGVPRMTLQKLVTGKIRITADMALKLADAFPHTTGEMWMNLQGRYELSRELREHRKPVLPLPVTAARQT